MNINKYNISKQYCFSNSFEEKIGTILVGRNKKIFMQRSLLSTMTFFIF